MMAATFLAITRQSLELESCSNPLRIREVFWFKLKKTAKFCFFVCYVIIGVGLRIFGRVHLALSANPTSNFRLKSCLGN